MALDPKKLKSIIDAHITKATKEHGTWDKWRAWYRSEFWGENNSVDDPLLIENNYLYAFADTMVASVCPPNPQVTCSARREDDESKMAARYREALSMTSCTALMQIRPFGRWQPTRLYMAARS